MLEPGAVTKFCRSLGRPGSPLALPQGVSTTKPASWSNLRWAPQGVLTTKGVSWSESPGGRMCREGPRPHHHYPDTWFMRANQKDTTRLLTPNGVGGFIVLSFVPPKHCLPCSAFVAVVVAVSWWPWRLFLFLAVGPSNPDLFLEGGGVWSRRCDNGPYLGSH